MSPERQQTPRRFTTVVIDGRLVSALVVEADPGGRIQVHDATRVICPGPGLRVRRHRHPIHMEQDVLEMGDDSMLTRALNQILAQPGFDNPVLGVLPAVCQHQFEDKTTTGEGAVRNLLFKALRSTQSSNPLAYPRLVWAMAETEQGKDQVRIRTWWARFADALLLAGLLRRSNLPLIGLVSGKRAMLEIVHLLPAPTGKANLVIDIGRLRTLFSGASIHGHRFSYNIPVGIERNDQETFEMLHRGWPEAALAQGPTGNSSEILGRERARFFSEVQNSAVRALGPAWKGELDPHEVSVFVSGEGSRHPAVASSLSRSLNQQVEPVLAAHLGQVVFPPHLEENYSAGEFLVHFGAIMGLLNSRRNNFGVMLAGRRPTVLDPSDLETAAEQLVSGGMTALYVLNEPLSNIPIAASTSQRHKL